MKYDLQKIRGACLELMGWRRETSKNFLDGKEDVIWTHKDGRDRYEGVPLPDPLPDPTTSLDDALPLFDRFAMALYRGHPIEGEGWRCVDDRTNEGDEDDAFADTAPLAVCLCALLCAGRDLKEFEK